MNLDLTGLPLQDIRNLFNDLTKPDSTVIEQVRQRDGQLTKPPGSLGRLEEIVEWCASWQGRSDPQINQPLVAIFAGNHGVVKNGVSAFPSEVTQQMVANFAAGGAAINQICKLNNIGLKVYELALELPTGDITEVDAFDEAECAGTMAFGMEAVASGTDLLVVGEMGIGNTTIASAIYLALFGGEASDWVGAGTGVDSEGLKRKKRVVSTAVERIGNSEGDPLVVLQRIGGREIAAMAGAILAARIQRIPVIVDGFVATAAAAVLYAIDETALDHCQFGHVSAENAHALALAKMNKKPILDLGMRLGEGTGAALAVGIIKAAIQVHNGMATFQQAGVADKD